MHLTSILTNTLTPILLIKFGMAAGRAKDKSLAASR